jgi:hypothetical protein
MVVATMEVGLVLLPVGEDTTVRPVVDAFEKKRMVFPPFPSLTPFLECRS